MITLVSLLLFVLLVSAISYFGYRHFVRPASVYDRLKQPVPQTAVLDDTEPPPEKGQSVRILEAIGKAVPFGADDSAVRHDLIAAGFRSDRAEAVFSGIRIIAVVLLPLIIFTFRHALTKNNVLAIVFPVFAGIVGYMGPGIVLEKLVARRHKVLRMSLPDALDLMVVAVEAGLGLDQAIYYTAKELVVAHKELCNELSLMGLEIRAGTRRSDAFRNLADRTGEPELKKLVSMLIQTDRFGTSVADSLRTHSDFMRVRRRQDAEERAAKVGIKLVFPIFFFLLPSMVLVSAGPGLLQVFKNLLPAMGEVGH